MDMENEKKMNRRDLFKGAGIAAAAVLGGSVLKAAETETEKPKEKQEPKFPQVEKRKFGKTDVMVSMLSIGGMIDMKNSHMLLRKAIDFGVTYWDTANGYGNGTSEEGIGEFFKKNPGIREKLFLVTKASGAKSVEDIEAKLQLSLQRMNTKYIDLYYGVHGLSDPANLNDDLKNWAKSAKDRGLIKHFGFSTHSNMADCLSAAAELDWIDGIMTTYNFELLDDEKMQAAVDKCSKKGIGLIAMKTQAKGVDSSQVDSTLKKFSEKGFTPEQAKMKIVWEDKRFCAICSQMPNFTILLSNVAAAMDKTKINPNEAIEIKKDLQSNAYCAGCEMICSEACPDMPYIRDVMRALMYSNAYGQSDVARETFNSIPAYARENIMSADYSIAQQKCPRNLPIANLVQQANAMFA
jgi:predicted aldo/keto reductase-like oxidoreductase